MKLLRTALRIVGWALIALNIVTFIGMLPSIQAELATTNSLAHRIGYLIRTFFLVYRAIFFFVARTMDGLKVKAKRSATGDLRLSS